MKHFLPLILGILVATVAGSGCKKSSHDHAEHSHGSHVHAAPHGGVLVELGAHAHSLEVVRDPELGEVMLYVLDAHAENFVRIAAPQLEVLWNGKTLPLLATGNPATGEAVGATSLFVGRDEGWKGQGELSFRVKEVDIRGTVYRDILVTLPAGK